MPVKRLIFLIGIFTCLFASAQPPHSFTRYGRESNFAGTRVEDMAQDRHGQLWIATWSGLYSFDGRDFQNYRTDIPEDRDNPGINRFLDVEILDDGAILVLSYDGRLYLLNAETRVLDPAVNQGAAIQKLFHPAPDLLFFLTDDGRLLDASFQPYCSPGQAASVHTMIADSQGEIWTLTDRGIYRNGQLSTDIPTFCAQSSDDIIYIGSADGQILRYWDGQLSTLPTQLGADITFIAKVPGREELLLGTDRQGIEIHNLIDGSHRHIALNAVNDEEGAYNCSTDARGNLWIYSSQGSLYWYDPELCRLVPFQNPNLQRGWNSETGITAFLADRQGNLWIGSSWGGLERVVFHEENFKLQPIDGSGQFTPQNNVRALLQDETGWFFAAARDSRVHILDEQFRERVSLPTGHAGYALTRSHDGRIWVGTKGSGLVEMSNTPGDPLRYELQFHARNDLFYGPNSNDVYSLLEDQSHRLWIGTFDDGVAYLDLDGKDQLYISKKNRLSFPTDRRNRIRCLAFSPDGKLYAGGQMGLFVCSQPGGEPEDMHFERFTQLLDFDVQHILFTRRSELYVSSFGAGLLRLEEGDPQSPYRAWTVNDGMLSNYIFSAIEDRSGNLWIATQGGLNRLNPQTGSLIGFPYDRLGHTMLFNEGQPLQARDGKLCFNTTAGIFYFDPEEISNSDFVPELIIQAFYVSGVRQPLAEDQPVRIEPSDRLRVQVAAVDLSAPEQILYSYKLEGRDKEWIRLGRQATITLPPLRPGKYLLRIRSTNGNGLDVDNERVFSLIVRRHPLRSAWSALFSLLAVAVALFLFARKRPEKKENEAEEEEDPLLRGLHGDDRRFVQDFCNFLNARLDDGALDVPQMCEAMNVSRSVLFERCRTLLGTTPATFLRRLRMERAQALIREGGRTMADISYAVGVNDPHYFSKLFKQAYGMTPTEFRDSLK